MPSYSGNLTVIANGAAGSLGVNWPTPTLPSTVNLLPGTPSVALLTLGSAISIPSTDIIQGIQIDVVCDVAGGGANYNLVQLIKASVQVGSNLSSGAWTNATFGGSSELWGTTWATTDFDTNFGVAVQPLKTISNGFVTITSATVTVYTNAGVNPLDGSNLVQPVIFRGRCI